MPSPLHSVLLYTPIPVAATIIGGSIAAVRPPSARVRSMVQHFAAGVVFAATAGEILPELLHAHSPVPTLIGFAIGVALMLLVKELTHHAEEGASGEHADPPVQGDNEDDHGSVRSMLIAVGIDITIDGTLIGVGFAAGATQGVMLTIALTLEVLFLGVSTAAAMAKTRASRARIIAVTCLLAALLSIGALIGATLLAMLSGPWLVGVLAFGAAALLYLVTEELLVEAHEVPETPMTTAVFFVGFISLFLIEMMA